PLIIWNQRWEYDKDPVRLFNTLARLSDSGTDFRLAICGENFRNIPDEFKAAHQRLDHHLIHYGYAERDVYERLLLDASVVISTAKHEFFGVAAVEAMAAGAVPVFPRGLSYPELVPKELHDQTLYESDGELDNLLLSALRDIERRAQISSEVMTSMGRLSWEIVAPEYDKMCTRRGLACA
ncbi:MAG: glycosyltransferase, partial [Acidimicrobiia bacterium]